MAIFKVSLVLGQGGGTQQEYIEAPTAVAALEKRKEYLDLDCYEDDGWILEEKVEKVSHLPNGYPPTPNCYGIYRG